MKTMNLVIAALAIGSLTSCINNVEDIKVDGGAVKNSFLSSYSTAGKNLKINLTDAPNENLKSVVVNIKSILLKAGGKKKLISYQLPYFF